MRSVRRRPMYRVMKTNGYCSGQVADMHVYLATNCRDAGDEEGSYANYRKALEIAALRGLSCKLAWILWMFASHFDTFGDNDRAIAHNEFAVDVMRRYAGHASRQVGVLMISLGEYRLSDHRPEEAVECYESALKMLLDAPDDGRDYQKEIGMAALTTYDLIVREANFVFNHFGEESKQGADLMHRLMIWHMQTEDDKTAVLIGKKAVSVYISLGCADNYDLAMVRLMLAEAYRSLGDTHASIKHLKDFINSFGQLEPMICAFLEDTFEEALEEVAKYEKSNGAME